MAVRLPSSSFPGAPAGVLQTTHASTSGFQLTVPVLHIWAYAIVNLGQNIVAVSEFAQGSALQSVDFIFARHTCYTLFASVVM